MLNTYWSPNLLDYLQGESDLYYGVVIPTLLKIKKRLDEIDERSVKHCKKNWNSPKKVSAKGLTTF